MDLSVFDTGLTPRNVNGMGSGPRDLDLDSDIFSDTLLEVAELPDDVYDDTLDDVDHDENPDQENDSNVAETDEASPETLELALQAPSHNPDLAPLQTLIGIQGATTSAATDITTKTPAAASSHVVSDVTKQAKPNTPVEAVQASLSGEAKTIGKRTQTIQANEKHSLGVKAQLAGAAENKTAQIEAAAKSANSSPNTGVAGRETITSGNEFTRLEQTLRQVFPASGNEATNTTANTPAVANTLRPSSEALLTSRGSEQTLDTTNSLTSTADRPSAMTTAKAAATRPAFSLPNGRPAEQVSVQVQNAIRNGNDRIQIKLSPASLGNVEVKLELSPDKTVQAIVYADKSETLDMLERDARVLQKALEEAGLRTNSDSLSFAQRDSGGSADAQADAHKNAGGDSQTGTDSESINDDSLLVEAQTRRSHDGLIDIEA